MPNIQKTTKNIFKKGLGLPRIVRPGRTKWGQNFLKDPKILRKISDFAQIEKTDTVLEVGPGEGTLTEFILKKAKKVIAIEKDDRLVEFLKNKFEKEIKEQKLEIISGDILEIEGLKIENFVLVGNIPYYITGALFKKFLESENQPKSITFVVQKEVADRIIARDGKESILSISIKAYGTPECGGVIKAGSFNPKPKVDSAILGIRNISKKRFEKITPPNPLLQQEGGPKRNKEIAGKFFEILKAGFAHKRKLLLNNLSRVTKESGSSQKIKEIFEKCHLSEKVRAENLQTEDWFCLAGELLKN